MLENELRKLYAQKASEMGKKYNIPFPVALAIGCDEDIYINLIKINFINFRGIELLHCTEQETKNKLISILGQELYAAMELDKKYGEYLARLTVFFNDQINKSFTTYEIVEKGTRNPDMWWNLGDTYYNNQTGFISITKKWGEYTVDKYELDYDLQRFMLQRGWVQNTNVSIEYVQKLIESEQERNKKYFFENVARFLVNDEIPPYVRNR